MANRLAILLIAVNTFLLSLSLMGIGLYGMPLLIVFGFWGLVNAVALLFSSVFAQKSALVWHIIFIGWVLVGSASGRPGFYNARLIKPWALVDLAAVFYLAKILGYLRARTNSKQI
jgi:hypothetical protein